MQNYIAGSTISQASTPFWVVQRELYRSSRIPKSVIGATGMVDVRTDGDHSVEHLSRTNVVASKISGESNRELPGLSPKNAEIAAAKTEASAATLSATPPPSLVEATADASEIL